MVKHWVPAAAAAVLVAAVFVVVPVTAQTSGTIYACINSHQQFTHVNTSTPQACPSQAPVSWPGDVPGTPGPSPSPSATTASPSPSATSPAPSPSPTVTSAKAWAWCSTSPGGFFTVPDGKYGIYTDEYNSGNLQTVCANSENDWQATFTEAAGNTNILTYPDVQLNYNTTQPAVSGLDPAATAAFTEDMNTNPATSAEAAFDIWIDGTGCNRCEVMIWTDTFNRGTVGGATDTGRRGTFCGDSTWQLWQYGSELIWYHPARMGSGTVCPAAMLQDLQSGGYLPADAALSQFEFGWEIASTGGVNETFQQTGYSTTGLPSGN